MLSGGRTTSGSSARPAGERDAALGRRLARLSAELRQPPSLPERLRWRLVAIPEREARARPVASVFRLRPRLGLHLRSAAPAAIASYLLVVGLVGTVGSPYERGREAYHEIKLSARPWVTTGRNVVADLRTKSFALERRLDAGLASARDLLFEQAPGAAPAQVQEDADD